MTIRLADIVRKPSHDNWLPRESTERSVVAEHELAMVRQIMRDMPCDMVPAIRASIWVNEPDRYGNNLFIEVQYAKSGWLATYAARVDYVTDSVKSVTCYMS